MRSVVEVAEKKSYDVSYISPFIRLSFLAYYQSELLILFAYVVAFKVYDMDRDGFISNGELFLVLKMMVGNNLKVSRKLIFPLNINIPILTNLHLNLFAH